MLLEKRVAIVTGGAKGMGRGIALKFAREGCDLVISDLDIQGAQKVADEAKALGRKSLAVKADISKKAEVQDMTEQAISRFGKIDILVNNAGGVAGVTGGNTETATEEDWDKMMDVNLKGAFLVCMAVIPHMKKQKWGRIINMTSFAAKQPEERLIFSNAIRAGILGLTKTLSNELAEDGILVNAVCPGWTFTKRVEKLARSIADNRGMSSKSVIEEWARQIPMKRLAHPEEIANLIVFLASQQASYITGTVMQVDGGYIKSLI